jgi:hypothetical protein
MAGIKIPISTDNTGLDAGAASAERRLNRFKGFALKTFAAVGAASGIVAGLGAIAERMDRIGKLSRSGLDVGFLQKLDLASQRSGTSLETSVKAIRNFVKEIRSADGPSAEVAAQLGALGLNLEALKKLNAQDLFTAISTSIGSLDDETDQLAAVTGLLGARYGDLLPLMQEVAQEGLPEMTTATRAQIVAIEDFNDSVTNAKYALMVIFAPVFGLLAKVLETFGRVIKSISEQLATFIFALIQKAQGLMTVLEGILELDPKRIQSGLDAVKSAYGKFFADLKKEIGSAQDDIVEIWKPTKPEAKGGAGAPSGPVSEDFTISDADRAANARANEKFRKEAARRRQAAATGRQNRIGSLTSEGQGIYQDIQARTARLNDPAALTVSSMRAIGGGGGVATPNEQRVLKVNEKQLQKLTIIANEIRTLQGGTQRRFN